MAKVLPLLIKCQNVTKYFSEVNFRNGKWNWKRILTTNFREPRLIHDTDIETQHLQFF